jgi:hypothetical protein
MQDSSVSSFHLEQIQWMGDAGFKCFLLSPEQIRWFGDAEFKCFLLSP